MRRDAGFSLWSFAGLQPWIAGVWSSRDCAALGAGLVSRMGGLLRQRQLLLRANQLIAADVERGMALAPELASACNLAGRQLWLQILGADGSITTYSLGSPPSPIWRGLVLMRCGPAYGLDGQVRLGASTPKTVWCWMVWFVFRAWAWLLIAQGRAASIAPVCWEQRVVWCNGSCSSQAMEPPHKKMAKLCSRGDVIAALPLDWLAWDRYLPAIAEFVIGASPLPSCLGCSNGDADGGSACS